MNLSYHHEGTGECVVLLHAFPLSKEMWRETVSFLTKNGFQVVAPDLPGFGESGATMKSVSFAAGMVVELLQTLGINSCHLLGLSMGGYVALRIACDEMIEIKSLIICDSTSLPDNPDKREDRKRIAVDVVSNGLVDFIDSFIPTVFSTHTIEQHPEVVKATRRMCLQAKPESIGAAQIAMADRAETTTQLKQLDIPTALIYGEHDPALADVKTMRSELRNSHLRIINDAGHYSSISEPDQFQAALESFLRGQDN